MKRVLIAALALVGFSAASFAQTIPAVKKNEPSKMQVVKKTTDITIVGKAVAMNKVTNPTVPTITKATIVKTKIPPVVSKPVALAKTSAVPLKKDGTPDKRYAANKHLKADGSKDLRYRDNKLPH